MTPEEVSELKARALAAPDDLALQIQAAYGCDSHGTEEDAVVFYDRAYPRRGELPAEKRWQFTLGYGSTLRNVKRYDESRRVLEDAIAEWPANPALQAFLALTLLDLGQAQRAVAVLFDTLLGFRDRAPEIARYQRAMAEYRDELLSRAGGAAQGAGGAPPR